MFAGLGLAAHRVAQCHHAVENDEHASERHGEVDVAELYLQRGGLLPERELDVDEATAAGHKHGEREEQHGGVDEDFRGALADALEAGGDEVEGKVGFFARGVGRAEEADPDHHIAGELLGETRWLAEHEAGEDLPEDIEHHRGHEHADDGTEQVVQGAAERFHGFTSAMR